MEGITKTWTDAYQRPDTELPDGASGPHVDLGISRFSASLSQLALRIGAIAP